jgi:hypothetical protein
MSKPSAKPAKEARRPTTTVDIQVDVAAIVRWTLQFIFWMVVLVMAHRGGQVWPALLGHGVTGAAMTAVRCVQGLRFG